MNDFEFGRNSKKNLIGVHPKLIQLAEVALSYSTVDFGISEGLRTIERQRELVSSGKSLTMNSYHLPQEDNYSHAIDVYAYVQGKTSYRERDMKAIAKAMYRASAELGIWIEWGGLWTDLVDLPHWQIMID